MLYLSNEEIYVYNDHSQRGEMVRRSVHRARSYHTGKDVVRGEEEHTRGGRAVSGGCSFSGDSPASFGRAPTASDECLNEEESFPERSLSRFWSKNLILSWSPSAVAMSNCEVGNTGGRPSFPSTKSLRRERSTGSSIWPDSTGKLFSRHLTNKDAAFACPRVARRRADLMGMTF